MIWLCYAIMVLVPYLLAGINFSIIVCKAKTGKDIRTLGSGNAGLTNTLRVVGKPAALIVLIGDVSKAAIAVLAVRLSFLWLADIHTMGFASEMKWVEYVAVFMAVVGHCFPLYYGFKGGKGVLAAVSGLFVMDWRIACALLGLFIILVAITRYVSLGSVAASVGYVFEVAGFGLIDRSPVWIVNAVIAVFTGLLIIIRHSANIKRLVTHTEKKLGDKAKYAENDNNKNAGQKGE